MSLKNRHYSNPFPLCYAKMAVTQCYRYRGKSFSRVIRVLNPYLLFAWHNLWMDLTSGGDGVTRYFKNWWHTERGRNANASSDNELGRIPSEKLSSMLWFTFTENKTNVYLKMWNCVLFSVKKYNQTELQTDIVAKYLGV